MKSRKIKEMKKMKFKHHTGNNGNRKCECGFESILPELLPWYLFVIVLCIRIHYVLQPKNWWLLHPDEIFQSVEVAFSEVYGNGFRTYEYSPSTTNVTTPVEEQEMNQGMYSLRSFLYPQFFAVIFAVCKFVGIRLNCYLVGRICQCVVTSFTPVAVFRFCRTLFRCRGTASIAAMLTSFSLHISVLGTHTLVNSFISPFLFLSVDIILQYLLKPPAVTDFSNDESLYNDSSSRYNHTENGSASIQCTMRDINSNLKIQKNPLNGAALQEQKNSLEDGKIVKEVKAKKSKPKKHHLATRHFTLDINVMLLSMSGFVCAIMCYMRPDTIIFLIVIGVSFLFTYRDNVSIKKGRYLTGTVGSGFAIGLIVGGLLDWYTYGIMFISPAQWLKLNVASHVPAVLYGTNSPYQYILDIFASCKSELCFNIFCLAALVMMTQTEYIDSVDQKSSSSLLITLSCMLIIYSVIAHKELRFVHNVLIIIEILAAYAIHGALQFINSLLKFTKDKIKIVVMVFSLSVGLNTYMNFPSYGEETILPWKTVTPTDSSDINQCLFFISEQNNVTGVFIDNSIYTIAGFTILNHDVPLLTLIHHEYHEYRSGGYIPRTDLSYKTPRNLYVINRYSDIIDVTNIHYLSKRLLESQEYNYVVVPNKRVPSFSQLGFNKAPFSAGRYSVLQRLLTPIESTKLSIAGKNMPLGKNSTIMEYEASWLYTAGLYTKAIERLENAIELNNSRVRPFQLLASSYANKADLTKAKATEDKCILGHGRTACRKPQPRIVIHEDYKQYSVN
ncbi:Hypothetical predicted protein [Mytilus galloprovincialis]|uniref:Mannosyltransferase n=2 Tax=Mytilus galloprovincialis TaxID=29158 RepID=A0A8B6EW54_MYTGA|nr:Hypothetical predicted protein [Mytilus galloprovincialis]